MSDKPIAGLGVLSSIGGIIGFTKAGSVPSLAAGVGIGALMIVSSLRIADHLSGGAELATATSAVMTVPMARRAFATRSPVPITMALLASASTVYYGQKVYDERVA